MIDLRRHKSLSHMAPQPNYKTPRKRSKQYNKEKKIKRRYTIIKTTMIKLDRRKEESIL